MPDPVSHELVDTAARAVCHEVHAYGPEACGACTMEAELAVNALRPLFDAEKQLAVEQAGQRQADELRDVEVRRCCLCGAPWVPCANKCECGGFCTWTLTHTDLQEAVEQERQRIETEVEALIREAEDRAAMADSERVAAAWTTHAGSLKKVLRVVRNDA